MALVIARTRKSDGGKVYWDGIAAWWPDINRGLRFHTEAEAKEAVADFKMNQAKQGLKPHDTTGYDYEQVDDETVLSSGPSGNARVSNYEFVKDTEPNGFSNE